MEGRNSIIGGIILIFMGGLFLLFQLFPGSTQFIDLELYWPLIIVAVGALFLLSAVFGAPPLAIPGMIVTGIGSLLFYQNLSGDWGSWAYVWTLIPGFVGLGIILMGVLDHENRDAIRGGLILTLISAVMFVIFAGFLSDLGFVGDLWPILLILAGLWILFRNRRGKNNKRETL